MVEVISCCLSNLFINMIWLSRLDVKMFVIFVLIRLFGV